MAVRQVPGHKYSQKLIWIDTLKRKNRQIQHAQGSSRNDLIELIMNWTSTVKNLNWLVIGTFTCETDRAHFRSCSNYTWIPHFHRNISFLRLPRLILKYVICRRTNNETLLVIIKCLHLFKKAYQLLSGIELLARGGFNGACSLTNDS